MGYSRKPFILVVGAPLNKADAQPESVDSGRVWRRIEQAGRATMIVKLLVNSVPLCFHTRVSPVP